MRAGRGQGVAEVLAVGGVDERVRSEHRGEVGERASAGGEDDRGHHVVALRGDLLEGGGRGRGSRLASACREKRSMSAAARATAIPSAA